MDGRLYLILKAGSGDPAFNFRLDTAYDIMLIGSDIISISD